MHKVIKSNNKKTIIKYKKTVLSKKPTVCYSKVQANANMLAFQKATYKQQFEIIQYIKRTNKTLYNQICNNLSVITATFYQKYNCNQTQLSNIVYAVEKINNNLHNKYVNCTSCNNILNKYYRAQLNTLHASNIVKHAYNKSF